MLLTGLLVFAALSAAWAAEKYENADLKITLEAPEGFVKVDEMPKDDDFIGKIVAVYASPDFENDGASLVIHHMDIPGGVDYDTFKGALAEQLKQVFGDSFELVKQEDIKLAGREGFVLNFKSPGDGKMPTPDGKIPHHIGWVLLKDGDSKLIGLIYGSRESAWEGTLPKFKASAKTAKAIE